VEQEGKYSCHVIFIFTTVGDEGLKDSLNPAISISIY
jgi:hypothetical protein